MKIIKVITIFILIVITYYSLKPPTTHNLPTNDKLGHFLAYSTLSFHLLLLYSTKKNRILAILFAVSYGLLMELIQGFIPGRQSSFYDILANTSGVAIGLIIISLFKKQIISVYRVLGIMK